MLFELTKVFSSCFMPLKLTTKLSHAYSCTKSCARKKCASSGRDTMGHFSTPISLGLFQYFGKKLDIILAFQMVHSMKHKLLQVKNGPSE